MEKYGFLTAGVPVNIYAIAAGDSLVDFGNYVQTLRGEVEFITIVRPEEFGLRNVEGAVLTGERHILIDKARAHFESRLGAAVVYGIAPGKVDSPDYDLTIDATFCANDAEAIDRYEPCITGILRGQTDKAVTIMDGRFPSIFPWNETEGLSSITSALLTPISKCSTWTEAQAVLRDYSRRDARDRVHAMIQQMRHFWPDAVNLYAYDGYRLGVRAMPKSAADARLVDVVRVGERALRVRAGKIDAVLHAESVIMEMIGA